ncbi:MAG: response regulator [Desulforhabdus sp.]|jgi:DNA-binding response OmpR family regulator|nr:response regulator [Desulforhabdus sp.]
MGNRFHILIADRNRHVREFLRRELISEGYRVQVAKDDRELLSMIDIEAPDLLILDLEIPYGGGLAVLHSLKDRNPPLPVVIHTFLTEYASHPVVQEQASFVEKMGNIDVLKAAILEMLKKSYPYKFGPLEKNCRHRIEDES